MKKWEVSIKTFMPTHTQKCWTFVIFPPRNCRESSYEMCTFYLRKFHQTASQPLLSIHLPELRIPDSQVVCSFSLLQCMWNGASLLTYFSCPWCLERWSFQILFSYLPGHMEWENNTELSVHSFASFLLCNLSLAYPYKRVSVLYEFRNPMCFCVVNTFFLSSASVRHKVLI